MGANAMCDRCVELDEKIERYRLIKSNIADQALNDAADRLIAEMEAEKDSLHPSPSAS
jgi:hypothetical protein